MSWKDVAMLITVGTGVGGDDARDSLAHGILFSIIHHRPKKVVFFGSDDSKNTIISLKKQYLKEIGEELDYDEFILVNEIDSFSKYFREIKYKILELDNDYDIVIDYTSGTKTMTMAAAFASMLYRKKLIFINGKREKGIVIKGTEKTSSQNLYLVYDELMISKIKELFNINRFEAGRVLLEDIVDDNTDKEIYARLFNIYNYFDKVDYENAFKLFDKDFLGILIKKWPHLRGKFIDNRRSIQTMTEKNNKYRCYYILASLLNNARRRYEENKYDDAIARLYRSLELIAQIRLIKQYSLSSSNIDVEYLKKRNLDEEYIDKLSNLRNEQDNIRLSLFQDYELLCYLNDDLGIFFMNNKSEIFNCLEFRNKSILAHGLNNLSKEEYYKFEAIVLEIANILNENISDFLNQTMFPYFD